MKKVLIIVALLCVVVPTSNAHALSAIDIIKGVAEAGYWIYEEYYSGGLTLEEARDQLLDAIENSQDAILDHIDNIAAVEPRTCGEITFYDFDNLDVYGDYAPVIAGEMVECVVLTHNTIEAVQDPNIVDELGFLLHMMAPTVLLALEQTGLDTDFVIEEVLSAEVTLDEKLDPYCHRVQMCEPGTPLCENMARCVAYNGDEAIDVGIGWAPSFDPLIEEVLENTSASIESGLEIEDDYIYPDLYQPTLLNLQKFEYVRP